MGVGNVTVVFLGTGSHVHGQHTGRGMLHMLQRQEDVRCRDRKMLQTGRCMLQGQEDVYCTDKKMYVADRMMYVAETGRCMLQT